jgi:hypothetical protein
MRRNLEVVGEGAEALRLEVIPEEVGGLRLQTLRDGALHQKILRQYLYVCTSKAGKSKSRTCISKP